MIRFTSVELRDNALSGGIIIFDRKPFVMKAWNSIDDFTKKKLDVIPAWI